MADSSWLGPGEFIALVSLTKQSYGKRIVTFVKNVPPKSLVLSVRRLLAPVRRLVQRDRQTDAHTGQVR